MTLTQLSFSSYVDNVAHAFNDDHITGYCELIDQKEAKGLKCKDFKQQLLEVIATHSVYNSKTKDQINAYNFIKNDIDN